jgi:hypothetical protein
MEGNHKGLLPGHKGAWRGGDGGKHSEQAQAKRTQKLPEKELYEFKKQTIKSACWRIRTGLEEGR